MYQKAELTKLMGLMGFIASRICENLSDNCEGLLNTSSHENLPKAAVLLSVAINRALSKLYAFKLISLGLYL
jgi:hypothetical protein